MRRFRFLTLGVFLAATVPRLAHRGMFVDGVTYASVARNLAEGRGTFWYLSYTATLYPHFREHPPLGFWLQSLWFRVLGDHLFVERVYAITAAAVTAVLIAATWRRLAGGTREAADRGVHAPAMRGGDREQPPPADLDWLPVLLWITVPVVSWAIVGNLLETTVALFTTAAALSMAHALGSRAGSMNAGNRATIAWSALSGLCIAGAVLTKGPVGLFPLVIAPVMLALRRDPRRAWLALPGQWLAVVACAVLLAASGAARSSLTEYVNQQVVAAVAGDREVGSSTTIARTLVEGVLLPMMAVGAVAVAVRGRVIEPPRADREQAWAFLIIGLAGTLPIMVSAKQAGHYVVPAVPMFALAAALAIAPTVRSLAGRFHETRWRVVPNLAGALLLVVAVGASVSPALGRDRQRMADLDAIARAVPRNRIMGICPASSADWGLHAWFERLFRTSLDAREGQGRDWFLETAAATRSCVPSRCSEASDPERPLVVLACRQPD
jgi:4-amino-4-deoxy-L-arabinose transferase-like glycosyltransferase